jgi:hypothetical protein
MFVGLIPLISTKTTHRAAVGLLLAVCSAVLFSETEPFLDPATNLLALSAQYAIFLTFGKSADRGSRMITNQISGAALAISTNLSGSLDPLAFGAILVLVNLVVIGLAVGVGSHRHRSFLESERRQHERKAQKIEW